MFLASSCRCHCPIQWSQELSREWRCSWSSADRRCSNYIWVINNFIAYRGATYIRDLMVVCGSGKLVVQLVEFIFRYKMVLKTSFGCCYNNVVWLDILWIVFFVTFHIWYSYFASCVWQLDKHFIIHIVLHHVNDTFLITDYRITSVLCIFDIWLWNYFSAINMIHSRYLTIRLHPYIVIYCTYHAYATMEKVGIF